MATLRNNRLGTDVLMSVTLMDNLESVSWSTVQIKEVFMYASDQRAYAGRCTFSIDSTTPTTLHVTYPAGKQQYLGAHRLVVRIIRNSKEKTYDAAAFNMVATSDSSSEVTTTDSEITVGIVVQDVNLTTLDEILKACQEATDEAEEAAELVEELYGTAKINWTAFLEKVGNTAITAAQFATIMTVQDFEDILDLDLLKVEAQTGLTVFNTVIDAVDNSTSRHFRFIDGDNLYTVGYNPSTNLYFITLKVIQLMAKITISGAEVFQIPASMFTIGPSASGYTLNYSADGTNFTAWPSATAANVNEPVINANPAHYYKLVGNTANVDIAY